MKNFGKDIQTRANNNFGKVISFFVIFYAVGIAGLLYQQTFSLFVGLIPLALLLSTFATLLYHKRFGSKTWFIFALIYFLGFGIEVAGVNTKLIFGHYTYSTGLGFSLFNTPLIIGINWLLLVYISGAITLRITRNKWLQILLAALLLVVYDVVLEQLAPLLKMWNWKEDSIPMQNYIAWFILAFAFSAIIKFSGISLKNKIAPFIFGCQILFFVILYVGFKLAY